MNRLQTLFTCLLLAVVLVACGANEEQNHSKHSNHQDHNDHEQMGAQELNLSFQLQPKQPTVDQESTLIATVKNETDPVTDANVELEVWKDGDKEHQMHETQPDENGNYQVKTTFSEPGKYFVIVHVNTDQVHQMIDHQFEVQ